MTDSRAKHDAEIPETMQAIVCHGPLDYRLEELPTPIPEPGEALVRVRSVGICASDLKCYQGAPMFWGDEHRQGYCQAPIVPGHEFVGEVVAVGRSEDGRAAAQGAPAGATAPSEAADLPVGAHVVSEQIVPCGRCRYCLRGQYWMCMVHDIYGFRRRTPGAMAEYMKFPTRSLNYVVPEDVPVEYAAFVEPLACAIHAVDRGNLQFDDTVVIAGCGPLGLGMVAAANMRSPASLVALDLNDKRLEVARSCGADITLNPSKVDAVDEISRITGGYGCDVYIEATGHPQAVEQGLRMLRKLGTFVEFSVMREPVSIDWTIIGDTKELDVLGAHLSPYCYPTAIRMIREGLLPMEQIMTHALALARFEEGMQLVASGTESIKVTLTP